MANTIDQEKQFKLPEGYKAPTKAGIIENIKGTGFSFKGEEVPWGIAIEPTVLPVKLGEEINQLGEVLVNAYNFSTWLLKHGPVRERALAERFVKAQVPPHIPSAPESLDNRRGITLMRPDLVIASERQPNGSWTLTGGIAEVETRPAGTYMIPALMEGYGLDRSAYMEHWVNFFADRPWLAFYPQEWKLYLPELEAFGQEIRRLGGDYRGLHCLDGMTKDEIDKVVPEQANVYLFGYMDVWERAGSLDKAMHVAQKPQVISYNPLNYHYETKATLVLFQQPWFQELMAKEKKYGPDQIELLNKWLIEGHVLNVEAPQDMNPSKLVAERNSWVIKRAGFHPEATESKGLVMPKDKDHERLFVEALRQALSGQDTPWIAQRFLRSRMPQQYYRPDTGEVDVFQGSMRLTPMYIKHRKETHMAGVSSTVTYMSEKAHGGSGKEIKPGMSVMAPVVFADVPEVTYS
ncbi:hypothetical protein HYW42_02235 [Candidatus Daviesbacteria bacterium]|nr:hypothetical protein [Candidatus Daviesbacteria bacterium]